MDSRELDEPSALRWMSGRKGWVSWCLTRGDEAPALRRMSESLCEGFVKGFDRWCFLW